MYELQCGSMMCLAFSPCTLFEKADGGDILTVLKRTVESVRYFRIIRLP